jgi:hypothetical protein
LDYSQLELVLGLTNHEDKNMPKLKINVSAKSATPVQNPEEGIYGAR